QQRGFHAERAGQPVEKDATGITEHVEETGEQIDHETDDGAEHLTQTLEEAFHMHIVFLAAVVAPSGAWVSGEYLLAGEHTRVWASVVSSSALVHPTTGAQL